MRFNSRFAQIGCLASSLILPILISTGTSSRLSAADFTKEAYPQTENEDDEDEDEDEEMVAHDRKHRSSDRKKAKRHKNAKHSRNNHHQHEQPVAPVHPEVLELLRNMNRTLKSIETQLK